MAPPRDWEAIASEGANSLAVDWNNTKGKKFSMYSDLASWGREQKLFNSLRD